MQSAKSQIETLSVLVVEDDQDIRVTLEDTLASEGMRVATAANGAEALAYLRAHALPDVILLDLMMPVMDGPEFRAAQLADDRLAAIPVVVLSANRDSRSMARAIGAASVLSKPLDLEALVEALERAHAPKSSVGAIRAQQAEQAEDDLDPGPPTERFVGETDSATDVRRKKLPNS